MMRPVRAYIGLGSNLDRPLARVRAGMEALARLPDSHCVRCSSLYRTAPVGVIDQPDFINGVCAVDTSLAPLALMRRLLAIEETQGRRRGPQPGIARTLDLDLLLYEDLELQSMELTLPHPRMHERAFVLAPLLEIAGDIDVPGRGPIRQLLDRCSTQRISRVCGDAATEQNA